MPTYKQARWIFLAAMVLALAIAWTLSAWWPVAAVGMGWLMILVIGSASIRAGFFVDSICAGPGDRRAIALTFDDGPQATTTPVILDILAREKVPAAFFCIGSRLSDQADLARRIHAEGHLICNHTDTHAATFDLWSKRRMLEDMKRMVHSCENRVGIKPRLFRPPYGVTNPNLARAIREGGFISIGWNLRSWDTMTRDPGRLLNRLLAGLRPGGIILLHDTCDITVEVLPAFIRGARTSGYEFVRLDRLIQTTPYA